KGIIKGQVVDVIFKGMHYEITVESGRYEMVIQGTRSAEVGETIGMVVEPDGIHVIKAEDETNYFNVDMNKDHRLEFNGTVLDTSLTKIIKGSRRDDEGHLIDSNGEIIDPDKLRIVAAISPDDIRMTDDVEESIIEGEITSLIYEGDHYSYVVSTEIGQDFIVHDEYLWNMEDWVGLIIPVDKMKFSFRNIKK
ncbi:MAG: TOBE domain-containing protein, partial [Mogibacterium sp.]|nr:TOBE domain-containing protein [Mogibacterium sp.]